jgi:hypothetical protein
MYGHDVQNAGEESIHLSTYGDFVEDASEGMDLDSKYGPIISKSE